MKVKIESRLKPLYANLLRLDIGEYLISRRFELLSIEKYADEIWNNCMDRVHSESTVAIAIPGYTGDAEKALAYFLTLIYKSGGGTIEEAKELFIKILGAILVDFSEWCKEDKDLSGIKENLLSLGYKDSELKWIEDVESERFFKKGRDLFEVKTPKKELKLSPKIEKIDKKLCFVLMPIRDEFQSIYEKVIKKATKGCKIDCKRADEIFGTKPIIEDIWHYIKKAQFLIADLTGKNPNVFYEVGLAHAIQKNVIFISQDIKDIPFDLRHYRCIVYEDSISGADELKEKMEKTIKTVLEETK